MSKRDGIARTGLGRRQFLATTGLAGLAGWAEGMGISGLVAEKIVILGLREQMIMKRRVGE